MFTYIVWSPQGEKPPTVTYNRRWKAEYEAKRLSQVYPNQVFNVCKVKSTTVAGQSAYFGKWRPKKQSKSFIDHTVFDGHYGPKEECAGCAVSEADLIDDQSPDMLYRLGMAKLVMR